LIVNACTYMGCFRIGSFLEQARRKGEVSACTYSTPYSGGYVILFV
jgi:hypothetical protein